MYILGKIHIEYWRTILFLELTEYDEKVNDLVRKIIYSENTHRINIGRANTSDDTPIYNIIEGQKYTKILSNEYGIWGFIVKEDDDKFKKGDILKAKDYNTPIRTSSVGNIYDENLEVSWFGAE